MGFVYSIMVRLIIEKQLTYIQTKDGHVIHTL